MAQKSQNSSLIDDEQSQKVYDYNDSRSQDLYKQIPNTHKKIKKYSAKRKSCNWGSGRPSKNEKSDLEIQKNQLLLKEVLSNLWFGTDISLQLITYLCKMGNMIPKVVTGIPASKNKKDFMKYDIDTNKDIKTYQSHQEKKKYSNSLKKDLKDKHKMLLEYLQYSEDTTYLFLGDNKNCQDKLYLGNYIMEKETKIGLEVVIKNLSPKFVPTYKFLVQDYYQNNNVNFEILVDNILNNLIENQQNHKMIFDRQLIYELTKDDINLINQIESKPSMADFHMYQNTSIRKLNFQSNTFNDEVEEINRTSPWIRQFIGGFIEILQNCGKNTQANKTLSE
ncbi:unnamed protein product [Paramecium octaurelia]|uniref:Uncharacterized protein n=1 Tax=Paramecium octaurelia TaxID=43137 RepID=A0A8S1VZ04_PAROT|nr:unnamed protein product [Paramecium octaurelia]